MLHRRIPTISIRRVNELRGSNSLHVGFDKAPPKLAPYMI
jgi:hypothetical protein